MTIPEVGARVGEADYVVSGPDVTEYMHLMDFPEDLQHTIPTDFIAKRCMDQLWSEVLTAIGPNIRAKQAFDFFAPIAVGSKVHAIGYCVDRYERRNKQFVVLEALFTDQAGNLVIRDRRTQVILTGRSESHVLGKNDSA